MSIEVRDVSKAFGAFKAVDHVTFTVASGELFALLGPSGCGKTTLLRIVAGLETADSGSVLLGGADATDQNARERGVGFVFQHYALFRHMTVFENVAFGLRVRPRENRPSQTVIAKRVRDLLGLVQLDYLSDRYPSQLSGGQRQRVALARALAVEPKVLLLDEPFGALDANVRRDLRKWLRRLHEEIKLTSVFVTHDQEEAFDLADRVVIMNHGRVEQDGHPDVVQDQPATPFVMNFVGTAHRFRGVASNGQARFGDVSVPAPASSEPSERPVSGYTRPYEFEVGTTETGGGFWALVDQAVPAGALTRLTLTAERFGTVNVELPRADAEPVYAAGALVYVTPKRVRVFLEEESLDRHSP